MKGTVILSIKRLLAVIPMITAIVFALPLDISAENSEQRYVVTVYNERNGLPTGEANDVLQTGDGYIWIGSYGGLIRYDGTTFRNFSLEGTLPSSSVRALFEDSSGRLWIGTNDAGVFYMENDVIEHINAPDDKSFLCVRGFDEGADGTIYAASNSGMAVIKNGTLVPCSDRHILGKTVYSVSADKFGRVWGALDSGICAVVSQNGEPERIFTSDEFFDGNEEIYCTAADSEGNIYLGSSGNIIIKLSFPNGSLEPSDMTVEKIVTEGVSTHNSIHSFSGGIIVCGSMGASIIRDNGTVTVFGSDDKASSVNSGCIDYEGDIWLASTSHGIIKYTKSYFDVPENTSELEDTALNAVAKQGDTYFAATDNGLLAFDKDWQPVSNALTELYNGVRVRDMMTDSKGCLWTAAYSYTDPVVCYAPDGKISSFSDDDGLINTSARTVYELSDGSIAVGTQGGVSIIKDGKVVKSYGSEDGLETCSVLCFLETSSGSLLVGSDGGGIYDINGGTVTDHGFSEGLSEGVVLRMLKDSSGSGYFISAGSSLYYFENDSFRKINIKKGAGSIFDLYDKDGKLWIIQNNGVLAFDKQAMLSGEDVLPQEYSFEHGLTGSVNANTWHMMSDDGRLYLSTRSGISIFNFETVESVLPKAAINGISVDGRSYACPDVLSLDKDAGRITIDFSALSFTDTTNIGISYILEGFDKEETVISGKKSDSVSYTNLPGGEYTFRLKVFDPYTPEVFNEYELPVVKTMKLSERPWFLPVLILVLIAASVGIAVIISRAKIKSIRKRQKEYRRIVEQSLQTFAKAIDAKDEYTNGHSLRVAKYSAELARRMGKSELEQENIYYIALLHDIGKIGIPDSILKKPGKLTDEEREIIRRHPVIGGEILKDFTALDGIADGAKYHHERFDGTGYCEHLAGDEIPEVARIIGVADTYDAMSSNRVYIKAFSNEAIIKELKECSGTQLDPDVVPVMLEMIEDGFAPVDPSSAENDAGKEFWTLPTE